MKTPRTRGNYAPVNGLNLHYELHGKRTRRSLPLVLLHGGVGGIEMMRPILPRLAKSRRVIAVDLQGHGRTADIDRPLRFELMADDIAGLLGHLKINQADIFGYSLGAGVAIQTAIRHPEVVGKLVVVSTSHKRNGWYPEVLVGMTQMGPGAAEGMKHSPLAKIYTGVNWESLFTKLSQLLGQDYDWSKGIAALSMPVMLVFADADSVQTSAIVDFFGLLGGGKRDAGLDGSARPVSRLAVIPGYTHYNLMHSRLLVEAVNSFLNGSSPPRDSWA